MQQSVILITGAARRIGAAIAQRLAQDGASVILHSSARSADETAERVALLRALGARAASIVGDLSDSAQTESLTAQAAQFFGPLTGLVNNASVFAPDDARDFSVADFELHMAVNLRAPLLLARAFFRQLPEEGEGAIVNILDQRVLRPRPDYFTYGVSKAALWAATRMLAQSFAPRARVNAVGPGPVLPNIHEGEAGFAEEVAGLPLQRAVAPDDIARTVAYLLAARSVTGQFIAVDCGQHLS